MTRFLEIEDVLEVVAIVLDQPADVRDFGLLDSAIHRPMASLFGADAYVDLFTKAAAMLESLARNYALFDGNKRMAWSATTVFLLDNGQSLLDVDLDEAYDFVVGVAHGELELPHAADWLRAHARPTDAD